MCYKVKYIPKPSRAQNPCTFTLDSSYNSIYIPSLKQTLPPAEAIAYDKEVYKNFVLHNGPNTFKLSRTQKYSQLSKGFSPNRSKTFATQSQTYSNPNTTHFERINSVDIGPNQLVGFPNNFSGPFEYNVPNPYGCNTNTIQDGGNLICNIFTNPCTGLVTESPLAGPVITSVGGYCVDISINWTYDNRYSLSVIPFNTFNIYVDGLVVQRVPYDKRQTMINSLNYNTTYKIYITASNIDVETNPSNIVTVKTAILPPPPDFSGNASSTYVNLSWKNPALTNQCAKNVVKYLIICSNLNNMNANIIQTINYISIPLYNYKFTGLYYDTLYAFSIFSQDSNNNLSTPVLITVKTLPLPTPSNFTGTGGCGSAVLSWVAPKDNNGNTITQFTNYYISTNSNPTASNSLPGITSTQTSATYPGLSFNTNYTFYIVAADASGGAISSIQTSNVIKTSILPAPINLFVTQTSLQSQGTPQIWTANLTWTPPTTGCYVSVTNYKIYRKLSSAQNRTLIATVNNTQTNYNATDLSSNNTYTFYVNSYNDASSGSESTDISKNITILPLNAPSLAITSPSNSVQDVRFNFTPPTTGFQTANYTYNLYCTPAVNNQSVIQIIGNPTQFPNSTTPQTVRLTLTNNTLYSFQASYVTSYGTESPKYSIYKNTYVPTDFTASWDTSRRGYLIWETPTRTPSSYTIIQSSTSSSSRTYNPIGSDTNQTLTDIYITNSYNYTISANYENNNTSILTANAILNSTTYVTVTGSDILNSYTYGVTNNTYYLMFGANAANPSNPHYKSGDKVLDLSFTVIPNINISNVKIITIAGGGGGYGGNFYNGGGGGGTNSPDSNTDNSPVDLLQFYKFTVITGSNSLNNTGTGGGNSSVSFDNQYTANGGNNATKDSGGYGGFASGSSFVGYGGAGGTNDKGGDAANPSLSLNFTINNSSTIYCGGGGGQITIFSRVSQCGWGYGGASRILTLVDQASALIGYHSKSSSATNDFPTGWYYGGGAAGGGMNSSGPGCVIIYWSDVIQ